MSSRSQRAITLVSSLLFFTCAESPTEPHGPRDSLKAAVDETVRTAEDQGFSGTVLVTADGALLVTSSHGMADRAAGTPNGPGTAFDFGSVMKDFTAAAIFDLADEGSLSIDDTLADVLPDVPADKAGITLRQILEHKAGFHEYHDTEGDFEPMSRLEARERIFAQELLFEPGTEEAYSNSGFTLLADIVETIAGRPFQSYVRDELMAPAKMVESGFYGDPIWDEVDTAIGYGGSTFVENDPATWPLTWALVGNGGLVTTARDLDRWLVAVRAGDVLSSAAFDAYEQGYLALGSAEVDGVTLFAFAGAGDYGLGGAAIECPELGSRVVVGTNDDEAFDIEGFVVELGSLVCAPP
ncbi:MAG: beta-lactamase family protein [Polyangiaceae bacterium]|nr:beta-lactamase family protein [Polyangiaceae bacterium]